MANSTQPRRRGTWGSALLLLVLPIAACGDDDESLAPALRVPDLGSYAYDAVIQIGDSVADTLSGSITITVASEDSIVGVWAVQGYTGAPQRGLWNVNAYTLHAQPSGPNGHARSMTHRIARRNATDDLECDVVYRHILAATDTFVSGTSQNDCSLTRQ